MASDDEQFREFVTTRWNALLRTAYLLTGDHGKAEDLVQSALERVHRRWQRILRKDSPEHYTRRVMINVFISASQRRRFQEKSLDLAPEPRSDDISDRFAERELLWTALLTLPPGMRATLILRFFEDLTQEQTASLLGCSLGSPFGR